MSAGLTHMMPRRALLFVLPGLGLVAALLVVFAGARGGLASGADHETEVRVAAQRLADGRMEFALQQLQGSRGWSARMLPSARFFPAGATVNHWLASSPLTVSTGAGSAEVRVAARRLADGRTEFALQQLQTTGGWGERLLPRARFFPAGTAVNRWLASSPLTVAKATRAPAARAPATPAMERAALVALYHALDGPNWTYDTLRVTSYSVSWLSGLRVADWEGVTVTGTAVTGLNRQSRGLAGELPPALGDLTNLRNLTLVGNLTGGIPREVGNLTDLRYLWLSGPFTGAIRPEVGNLTNLRFLALLGGFTGEIPSEVGNLTSLTELHLLGTFMGEIPREVGHLFNLQRLSLRGFTGEIPGEIGNLAHLTALTLTGRTGTGTGEIPGEIGNLTKLTELHIEGDFTGEIPREIGNLTKLTELHIQGNFTGEIPREVGNLTNLTSLSLYWLSGEIPREIGNLTNLTELHIRGNLTGEIPPEIGSLTGLQTLVLAGQFTGAIPREIGNLTNLAELQLGGQFTCIPGALRDMSAGITDGFRLPECNPPDQ